MLKGIIEKLLKSTQPEIKPEPISQADVEALIEEKLKEHDAATQATAADSNQKVSINHENNKLTPKQVDYVLSIISKLDGEYVLANDPSLLTLDDFNKLISYNRYKNKGILVNLAKKGVLKKN